MIVSEIAKILDAQILCLKERADSTEIMAACGSDMMSDVLAYVENQGLLLTGLVNAQVIRTAEMMDILCVGFVRGKMPDASILELAEEKGIIILSTELRMFPACGLLFKAGLKGHD